MKITDAIRCATERLAQSGIQNARLDAEVLLSRLVEKDRVWLITHNNDSLDNGRCKRFDDAIERRSRREPLQYILERQEFWGLEFIVTPDVLIPRPETEWLVERAVSILSSMSGHITIVDLCTGSGCVAISLAKEFGDARIFGTDNSPRALVIAKENAQRHGVADRIRFLEGDLYRPLEELDICGLADVITANPPYIRSEDLPMLQPEVRDYEPEIALVAGPKGTEIQQRIIENAPVFLKKHGALIMEMGMGQADVLKQMVEATGAYRGPDIQNDLAGIERAIIAKKK